MKSLRPLVVLALLINGLVCAHASGQPGTSSPPQWTWTDFEVVGQRTVTREQVLESTPVELGTPYEYDREAIGVWCTELEERLDLHRARCSPVRFFDGKTYLVISLVEKGDEHRTHLRAAPEGDVELATAEILEVFEKLQSRQSALFNQGKPPKESADEGYLDYDDPEMHDHVERLRTLVPPYRDNLLGVIARDGDDEKRAAAATLLNWAGDVSGSIARVHGYLDDPSVLVRNNICRFLLHYIGGVESAVVRRGVVDQLAVMLDRPSHADRNKATYGLLHMVRAFPEDSVHILESAGESLSRLVEQSILMNVRDPAEELMALLHESAGESDKEGVAMKAPLERQVDEARSDLAKRLSIAEDELEVVSAERVTWRDSSLGCPEKGRFYMQAMQPGVLIKLRVKRKVYPYHGRLEGPPVYCEKPSPVGPLPTNDE